MRDLQRTAVTECVASLDDHLKTDDLAHEHEHESDADREGQTCRSIQSHERQDRDSHDHQGHESHQNAHQGEDHRVEVRVLVEVRLNASPPLHRDEENLAHRGNREVPRRTRPTDPFGRKKFVSHVTVIKVMPNKHAGTLVVKLPRERDGSDQERRRRSVRAEWPHLS
jgi:hypothetical protein